MFAKMPFCCLLIVALCAPAGAWAQDKGTLNPTPLPPLAKPNDPSLPARELFGRKREPTPLAARALGFYSKGCLAGAMAMPVNGDTWQVMRLSRNRNWGHPDLLRLVERIAEKGKEVGWNGLLVGDISQPRGGPMLTGHASHQVGLDADIWLTPMPERELTRQEREEMSATDMVRGDRKDVDTKVWTPRHTAIIKVAAEQPEVDRIFVNPAIKKALCRDAGKSRAWLSKVRPYYKHNFHFHIRMRCPSGMAGCESQPPVASENGCGKELDWWFTDAVLNPKPPKEPPKPKPPLKLADLPAACRQVLLAP
jgi:penicillin-insensitive murein DD-endopeptidase